MKPNAIIEIQSVSKIFQEGSLPFHALRQVSLNIEEGTFAALCGPSGSGKTTLLNLIGCLDRPTEGDVKFDGEVVSRMNQHQLSQIRLKKIGFVFQDYNLIPTLTASENVEYVLWLQGVSRAERRKRAEEVLSRFGLGSFFNRKPSRLSRGQQQRVAVARAVVHRPRIVIGDELTANLDHKTGEELMDFLRTLNEQEKITFLYASHDPIMLQRAKQIYELRDGSLIRNERHEPQSVR